MIKQTMEKNTRMGVISICKKHPKHKQSPGVCSVCLNEKLSKIPSRSLRKYNKVSSSCSSSLSSISSISSETSPARCERFSIDHQSKGRSMSTFLRKNRGGKSTVVLTKSTSMAFVFDHRKGDGGVIIGTTDHGSTKNKDKKKSGFWSKLLRARTSKSIDHGLVRSMSMRERVNASSMVH